jgi:hypothetical protein
MFSRLHWELGRASHSTNKKQGKGEKEILKSQSEMRRKSRKWKLQ